MSAPDQQAAAAESGSAALGTAQLLRRYWQPRHWSAWLFILWLEGTALLPWRATVALHFQLGRALWYLLPRSRRVMLRNLEACFPQLTPAKIETLARTHFRNLGASIGEVALAWFGTAPWTRPPVRVEGIEHLQAALARGKGVILFTGHFTSVEIATQFLKPLIPLFAFMFTPRNSPVLDAMQTRGRLRTGHVPLPSTAIRGLVRQLQRNAVVWYAPDLAYVSSSAQLVPFFGEPAMTNTGASRLARLSGATVVPLYFRRLDGGAGYLLRFTAALENFPSDDVREDTRRLTAVLEGFIRECPEQYFWTQRKFKNRGAGLPDLYARR
ncbi:MAG: lysophospholipid acyltransferase family protein [Gammaproteobacteria bacterium]